MTIDVLYKELNIESKKRFHAVIADKIELDDEEREILKQSRITKLNLLEAISVKGWKNVNVPIGLKLKIEDLLEDRKDQPSLSTNRMRVQTNTNVTYECDRYCPHKGADMKGALMEGSVIICPKHKWKFDLALGGLCIRGKDTSCTLNAVPLDW